MNTSSMTIGTSSPHKTIVQRTPRVLTERDTNLGLSPRRPGSTDNKISYSNAPDSTVSQVTIPPPIVTVANSVNHVSHSQWSASSAKPDTTCVDTDRKRGQDDVSSSNETTRPAKQLRHDAVAQNHGEFATSSRSEAYDQAVPSLSQISTIPTEPSSSIVREPVRSATPSLCSESSSNDLSRRQVSEPTAITTTSTLD